MTRVAIELLLRRMNAAYRDDPFHGLRRNLDSVRPDEWEVQPATWSADVFGTDPELSIRDLVIHLAGAKQMYANRAFGGATLEWTDIKLPALERQVLLDWLDEGHRALVDGLAALADDSELLIERRFPWGAAAPREQLISIVINHDLYHSGEINRQRALIRGAEGWDRGTSSDAGRIAGGGTP